MLSLSVQQRCLNLTNVEVQLKPNPDIAGVGVLISFAATAFVVLLLVGANYFISFDPGKRPFRSSASHGTEAKAKLCRGWHANTVDAKIVASVRSTSTRLAGCVPRLGLFARLRSVHLEQAFNLTIVSICDMQIFTGAAILISGFVALRETVSAHHWKILVYLAWFTTTSHLAGLTAVRSYLHAFPRKRNLRLGFMLAIMVMLVVAIVPTQFMSSSSHSNIDVALSSSEALCFFDPPLAKRMWNISFETARPEDFGSESREIVLDETIETGMQEMVRSILLLLVGLFIRSFKIFSPLSGFLAAKLRRMVRGIIGRFPIWLRPRRLVHLQAQENKPSFLQVVYVYCLFLPAMATFYTLRLWMDLLSSTFAQIFWFLISMSWGMIKLLEARQRHFDLQENDEDKWTFGQILAILLLSSPLFSLLTILTSNTKENYTVELEPQTKVLGDAEICVCESHWTQLLSRTRTRSHQQLLEESKETMIHLLHHQGYYETASWLGPTVSITLLASFAETIFVMFYSANFLLTVRYTLSSFWYFSYTMVTYVAYALVPGTMFTILFGILLDGWSWLDPRRGFKKFLLLTWSIFVHATTLILQLFLFGVLEIDRGYIGVKFGIFLALFLGLYSVYTVFALVLGLRPTGHLNHVFKQR